MTNWNGHGIDWNAYDSRGAWLGCLLLLLSFAGGVGLGYVAWLWVSVCP